MDRRLEVQGIKVLNGLFGVKKPSCLADGRSVLRVIMNLKATNSVMHQVRGAVEGLPAITAWQAAVLELDEQFRFYQSDISSAFYLFELPSSWSPYRPYLAFAVSRQGEDIGLKTGLPGAPDGSALIGIPHARSVGRDIVESRTFTYSTNKERSTSS